MAGSVVVLSTISLHYEYDLVAARRRARQVAAQLGLDEQEQTRVATVASEIARNALRYGGGGSIEFAVERIEESQWMTMTVADQGRGIANLEEILSGRYQSRTGMGLGIVGARRLMDEFLMQSAPGRGTTVTMKKKLPAHIVTLSNPDLHRIVDELAKQKPENPIEEIQQQNLELLRALADLTERREELQRLNQELEDTNRGVLALYAELDEKAESLRHADRLKSRFLSDMSHEFRTPVNSIMALTRLLDEAELGEEGCKQVSLIRRSAEGLATLVEDLLDLAKIEAGKVDVHPTEFEIENLFSALRGMFRPLQVNRSLSLIFEDSSHLPTMYGDEGKISQILRNFISNALKFTESGEVRVSATLAAGQNHVTLSVADTGIGIAPENMSRVFDEFTQLDNPFQSKHKGTGLGLPLTEKLSRILGGEVSTESELNVGSVFRVQLPVRFGGHDESGGERPGQSAGEVAASAGPAIVLLIVDDDETARYTMTKFATRPGMRIVQAHDGVEGIARAQSDKPDVISLDLMMPGTGGHEVLQRLKNDPGTASIPVVVVSSRFINDEERQQILTRAHAVINKGDLSREVVSAAIDEALSSRV